MCAEPSSPTAASLVQAHNQAINALSAPETIHEPLATLAQIVVDTVHASNKHYAADAMQILFDLSCSGSGTRVHVEDPPEPSFAAVLILGYAGSSVPLLTQQSNFYRKRFGFKVVATVASGICDTTSLDRQCDQVCAALAGARKVLVHCMSNNGQGLFATLLHRKGSVLRSRVAAVVYDCAAARIVGSMPVADGDSGADTTIAPVGPFSGPAQIAHVIKSTVLLPLIQNRVQAHAPLDTATTLLVDDLRGPIDQASLWLAERHASGGDAAAYFWANRLELDGHSCHDYDAIHCPHVPVMCMTSPDDKVIAPEHVLNWGDFLRHHSDGRRLVRVSTAPSGSHCLLLQRHPDFYAASIGRLVDDAGINDKAAPIRVAHAENEDAAALPLVRDVLEPAGLAHLALLLADKATLDECAAIHADAGRPRLIAKAKEWGVASLGERQRFASAIGKWAKGLPVPVPLS